MSKIACRQCTSPDCHGCNIYTLFIGLENGKFDSFKDGNNHVDVDKIRPVICCMDCSLWDKYNGENGDIGLGWCDNGAGDTTHALFYCASGVKKPT